MLARSKLSEQKLSAVAFAFSNSLKVVGQPHRLVEVQAAARHGVHNRTALHVVQGRHVGQGGRVAACREEGGWYSNNHGAAGGGAAKRSCRGHVLGVWG